MRTTSCTNTRIPCSLRSPPEPACGTDGMSCDSNCYEEKKNGQQGKKGENESTRGMDIKEEEGESKDMAVIAFSGCLCKKASQSSARHPEELSFPLSLLSLSLDLPFPYSAEGERNQQQQRRGQQRHSNSRFLPACMLCVALSLSVCIVGNRKEKGEQKR